MATYLAGTDVAFYVKETTYTAGIWKETVCAVQHTLTENKTESTVITKCGSVTTPGTNDDSISLDLTFLTSAPASTELSAAVLQDMYRAGVTFEWKIADANPSAQYIDLTGFGVGTSCTSTFPAEGLVNVAFEFKVNGSITDNL